MRLPMLRSLRFTAAALALVAAAGCQHGAYQPTAHFAPATSQPVAKTQAEDAAVAAIIRPYHDKVTAEMQSVLGTAPEALIKRPGESPLANFVADLQRQRAAETLHEAIPLSVMTNGGLRAGLPAGPVTLGNVFELMPFENELVVLDAPAATVQQLFDYAARLKMAVSGATYTATPDGHALDIRIGALPFDPAQTKPYAIAISDYLAGGGDNMVFFKAIAPRHTGVLLRSAIADRIRDLTKAGQPVTARVEGRVRVQ